MSADTEARRSPAWGDTTVGFAVIAIALVCAWETSVIPTNAIYAQVGPKVIPWIATGMLGVLGIALSIEGLRGGWEHEAHGELNLRGIGLLLLGLFLNVALIGTAGFIIASTILFLLTAMSFGSGRLLRDGLIGFALAFVTYIGFDRLLGYKIGTGLIEAWL
ncbi:MAG: tripartite tricarboxylate transporter TctB family protein [Hyphomicrobiales bacterium]|nr:MAG: tripartite tricarboxylate transporter TctB family protein [Hyphomicrobiales bacterium]